VTSESEPEQECERRTRGPDVENAKLFGNEIKSCAYRAGARLGKQDQRNADAYDDDYRADENEPINVMARLRRLGAMAWF
jgi:hypothetical protein